MLCLMIVVYMVWEDVGAGEKLSQHKKIKGVNTTIHMGISHLAFSLHCIQVPACVIDFDQFLSCCCSDPLGIESLFETHSLLTALVILLVSKKMMLGWSFGLGEFPWEALLF